MQEGFKIPHVPFTSFKKNLRVGGRVLVKNYLKNYIYEGYISRIQSNGIWIWRPYSEDGLFQKEVKNINGIEYSESFLEWQRVKDMKVFSDAVLLLAFRNKRGFTEPSSTFAEGTQWLALQLLD